MLFWSLIACKSIEPAPTDIDGLSHFFWTHYDDEDDESLAEGIRNAFAAIDPANLEEPMKGSISDLSREELDLVGKTEEPVGEASGVYLPTSSTVQSTSPNAVFMHSIKTNATKGTTQPTIVNIQPIWRPMRHAKPTSWVGTPPIL